MKPPPHQEIQYKRGAKTARDPGNQLQEEEEEEETIKTPPQAFIQNFQQNTQLSNDKYKVPLKTLKSLE